MFKIPSGFHPMVEERGATLYRKNYRGGQPDFVVVADLAKGAEIRSFTGKIVHPSKGEGIFGGDNPTFSRYTLRTFWLQIQQEDPSLFAVMNAAFFGTDATPTRLAFSLKQDGNMVTDGYGMLTEYPGQIRLLRISHIKQTADVVLFERATFKKSLESYDTVIASLDSTANKNQRSYIGRTFVGTDENLVFLFCTRASTQREATKVLLSFGATGVIMMDAGGSSQLIVEGKSYVYAARKIPNVLAVLAS